MKLRLREMKASGISSGNVHSLPASQTKPDPFLSYSDSLRKSKVPIILDNGSYQCKAGWATEEKPALIFKNHIARHRGKKENETQVGNDIKNIEVVRWLLKTQFDRDVVTQFDVQEVIYDYIFSHLGINTDGSVEHPILLTEAVCNPTYSRQLMSELLFECYQVPQVAYGVDSLFSFHYNRSRDKAQNGLIISCGYHNCHVLPILKRRLDVQNCKRINIGGCHMIGYFHRTLQLKYPVHMSAITPSRAENLLHRHMHFSKCYGEDLEKWTDDKYYENQVNKIQLPFTPLPGSVTDTGVGKFEKCRAILRRVQAMKIKRRAEKLALDEERLQELLSVQELLEDEDDEAILALQELNYSSAEELQAGIKQLNCSIRKAKNNIAAQQGDDSQDSPLKHWCEELDLSSFSDTESWIAAVHQKRKELQESRIKLTSERVKSKGLVEFGSSKPPDFSGGVLGKQEEVQNFNDYISDLEERKERIGILDEISAEYNREFSKTEHSFSFSLADYYQLHIGVEKLKVPEIIFQPSLIGSDQAGLVETLEMVFARYNLDQQQILAQNIFLTGGCAAIPFLKERIEAELQSIRPFQSAINVYLAKDPVLDSWKGARHWALTGDNISKYSVSRSEYEEKGADYFKEHYASNWFIPMPQPVQKGILVGDNAVTVKTEQKVV